MRLSSPRISPLPLAQWQGQLKRSMGLAPQAEDMAQLNPMMRQVFNIMGTLANHPTLMRSWNHFSMHVMGSNTLKPRERELLILRTGWNCRSGYEWGQHAVIGQMAGLTAQEVERIPRGPQDPAWNPFDALLLRAADELHADQFIAQPTWDKLAERYHTRQLMDVVFTVGQYTLVSMALNSFGVQLDEGLTGLPDAP